MRPALGRASRLEELREFTERGGGEVDDLGLARAHRFRATPVEHELALRRLVVPLGRLVIVTLGWRLRLLGCLQLERRRELSTGRNRLQGFGETGIAARIQRDVHPAAGDAELCVAELGLGVTPAHQLAERGVHHPAATGSPRAAHAHAAESKPGERGHVDPGLRDRWFDDLLGCGLGVNRACNRAAHGDCDTGYSVRTALRLHGRSPGVPATGVAGMASYWPRDADSA